MKLCSTLLASAIEGRAAGSTDQSCFIIFTTPSPHPCSRDWVGGRLLYTDTATIICTGVIRGNGACQLSKAQSTMENE